MIGQRLFNGSMIFLLLVGLVYSLIVIPTTHDNRYIIQLTDGSKIEASYHGREEANLYYYPYKAWGFNWEREVVAIDSIVEVVVLKERGLVARHHVEGLTYTLSQ